MGAAAARNQRPGRRGGIFPTPVWWARLAHPGTDPLEHSILGVGSDRFPQGSTIDLAAVEARGRRPAGWLVDVRYRATDGVAVRVEVSTAVAAPRSPLWFAEISHATSAIPSTSLLAFAGLAAAPGSLVTPGDVLRSGLSMQDRIGELRWYTRSGLVEVLDVGPAFAGQGIDRVLLTVADGLRLLRGWAPLLRGDAIGGRDRRTGTEGPLTPAG